MKTIVLSNRTNAYRSPLAEWKPVRGLKLKDCSRTEGTLTLGGRDESLAARVVRILDCRPSSPSLIQPSWH